MSNEEFEILKSLLEKLVVILSKDNPFMPIILVAFGAFVSLIVQVIFWVFQLKKEKKQKIKELLAETFRQSQTLTGYYKMLVMHKVHKNYWHQSSEYAFGEPIKANIYYSNHLESSKEAFTVEFRIIDLYGEYVKALKSIQIYGGKKVEMIEVALKEMNDYKPRKPKTFKNIKDADLREAAIKEEDELNREYLKYSEYFNSINKLLESELM